MTKVMYREYEHGEVVAVFPNVAGDPQGETCVAYAAAGGFYNVDLDKVIHNSKPAKQFKRLEKELLEQEPVDHLTTLERKPAGSKELRVADTDAHSKFGRVARLHAHR